MFLVCFFCPLSVRPSVFVNIPRTMYTMFDECVCVCARVFSLCCHFSFMLLSLCERVICPDLFGLGFCLFCVGCAIGFLSLSLNFAPSYLSRSLSLSVYVVTSLSLQCFLNVYSPKISFENNLQKRSTEHICFF